MDSRVSTQRLAMMVCIVFYVGLCTPSLIHGSESVLNMLTSVFNRFANKLSELVEESKDIKKYTENMLGDIHALVDFSDPFKKGEIPNIIRDSEEQLKKFIEGNYFTHEYRKKFGLSEEGDSLNIRNFDKEVRNAFVILQDPTQEQLKNGEIPNQTIQQIDLGRVHKQRLLLLRNAAIKGITLSFEQQNNMYGPKANNIYRKATELVKEAKTHKDFAYVNTMMMLEIWSELRQQRQLLAALLQSQAAKNLQNDPLLIDLSPGPRQKNLKSHKKVDAQGYTEDERKHFEELKRLNEEYRRQHGSPTQNSF